MKSRFNIFILFCLLLCSTSCTSGITECDVVTGRICSQFAKNMQKQNLWAVAVGIEHIDKKNSIISMDFQSEEILTIDSSRKLIQKISEDFLSFLNQQSHIEQYLITYPFTQNNVEFAVYGKECATNDPDFVQTISQFNGSIHYLIDNPKNPLSLMAKKIETIEEAKSILKEKDLSEQSL